MADANVNNLSRAGDTGEPADLDAWLRRELGRQLALTLLRPPGAEADARLANLGTALADCAEMRVIALTERTDQEGTDASAVVRALLRAAAQADVAVVLVWYAGRGDGWPREAMRAAESAGLLDRAFVALVGPGVTRGGARGLGYEDGFSDTPASALLWSLAREVVRREEYLRRGSSPPCFLE